MEGKQENPQKKGLTRRDLLIVFGGAVTTTLMYQCRENITALFDPEVAQAIKVRELFKKIDESNGELDELQSSLNTNAKEVLLHPGNLIARLEKVRAKILVIVSLINEVKSTGFKVNSGVAYSSMAKIDAQNGRLNGGKIGLISQAVHGLLGIKGKIQDFTGISLDGIGKVSIPVIDVNIDAQQSMQIITAKDGLVASLETLKKALEEISSADIEEFSNNKEVNKEKESPRARLLAQYKKFADLADRKEHIAQEMAKRIEDEKPFMIDDLELGEFLEEYGFVKYPSKKIGTKAEENNARALTIAGYANFKAVMRTAIYAACDYKYLERKKTNPDIKKLQEMLARGGYLDYKGMDSTYGPITNDAFRPLLENLNYDEEVNYLQLDIAKLYSYEEDDK
ncbi:hypothetical protein KJ951_02655 [Patescibacteria group bacterium]|nr:hypothetical protein [Patescibacteria group bacterium]MBU1703281.1 hypothetical protein [Patescibacteria group bacterium]